MRRKKPAAPVVAPVEQSVSAVSVKTRPAMDAVWVCLFSLLLFLAMTVQTGRMSVILLVLALVLSVGKEPLGHLRQHFCVPVLGFIAFAFMQGFAAIYSHFGDYAVREYQKFLAAFALAVVLLVRIEKKHVRGVLWGVAAVCAVISFLCIDMASFGTVFETFNRFVELLGGTFSTVELNTWGTRVAGIYNDANVSGSILALGSLVALYLMNSEQVLWKRALASVLLGVAAMGFFLSMSRGAILCFALALLVWLTAAGKGNRLSLFFQMFFSAVVVVALSIPAASGIGTASVLPDVLTLVSGLLIFALDWALGSRLAWILEGKGKAIAVTVTLLVVLCIGYAVAAMTVTGPYTFDDSGFLSRTVDLEPGTYTLSGDWDGDISVSVLLQNQMELVHSTGRKIYEGPLEDASFTAVEGERLSFQLWAEPGTTIRSLTVSDGTEVALGHPLLPVFLANRLQDSLSSSGSTFLRLQYDKDALKLFVKNPVFGHGLGSTEGLYTSVQSFYYESKYAHNHILQIMTDMGSLGLLAFLALIGGGLWLLLRRLRSEQDAMAAMLLACWVMMNTHSLMEINFSIRAYQCLAYPLLLLPVVLYGEPLSKRFTKIGGIITACLLWLYMAVFGGLYLSHRMVERDFEKGIRTSDVDEFMEFCESLISRDVFDHEDNQLTYVANAVLLNDSDYNRNLRLYVKELRASGTYPACSGLARYYYLPKGQLEELFACSREGIAQEASSKDAWNLQLDFYRNEVLPAAGAENMDAFIDGVLALRDYLAAYSEGRLEEIVLTEENQTFLHNVAEMREGGVPNDMAYLLLTQGL